MVKGGGDGERVHATDNVRKETKEKEKKKKIIEKENKVHLGLKPSLTVAPV